MRRRGRRERERKGGNVKYNDTGKCEGGKNCVYMAHQLPLSCADLDILATIPNPI